MKFFETKHDNGTGIEVSNKKVSEDHWHDLWVIIVFVIALVYAPFAIIFDSSTS